MSLEPRLQRWVTAGLVTAEQAERMRELLLDRKPWRDVLEP
jgi:hypothetical protein